MFNVIDYYLFIINISTGMFSCLARIGKSFLYGIIYMGRMDKCVLMAEFESKDKGKYLFYILNIIIWF